MTPTRQAGPLDVEFVAGVLADLGLKSDSSVMVHSDLRTFGIVRNNHGKLGLALEPATLHYALRGLIGPKATIAAATFTYSWTRGLTYSPENSPGVEGSFGEYLRKLPGGKRSGHPMMSVTAEGQRAAELVEGNDDTSFGDDSPFGRMHRANIRHVTVGVNVCSFSDYVQWACRVPYRYRKRFRGSVDAEGGRFETECEHYVRFADEGLETCPIFDVLDADETGRIRKADLRKVPLRTVSSTDLFDMMREGIESDPYAFSTRPDDEAPITFLGRWLAEDGDRPQVVAIDRDGFERWIWLWPAPGSRTCVGFLPGPLPTIPRGINTVAIGSLLPGSEARVLDGDHRISDAAELTPGLLERSGWITVSGDGSGGDQAYLERASWKWIALMSRRETSGARMAIDIAAEWLDRSPDPEPQFAEFLFRRLVAERPTALMTRLEDEDVLRLPLFQPDSRGEPQAAVQ